jgi:hypothetical protein
MQGGYRVTAAGLELMESFIAAPGPMGWRYVGQGFDLAGRRRHVVDVVVDLEWNLVRFRWFDEDGGEAIALPAGGGLEVWTSTGGSESSELFPGARAVWCPSPSSLLVVDRMLGPPDRREVTTAAMGSDGMSFEALTVRLERKGTRRIRAGVGWSEADVLDLDDGGPRREALVRRDLPLSCEGWFELVS